MATVNRIKTNANDFANKIARGIINRHDDLKRSLEESVKTEFINIMLQYSTFSQSSLYKVI